MKIQKTTLILMISAVLLGGVVYFYEVQVSPKREQVKAEQQQLFNFKESEVKYLSLTTQTQALKFERVSEKEPVWMLQVMQPVSSNCETAAAKQTDKKPAVCEAPTASQMLTSKPMVANDKVPASDASVAYLLNLITSAKFDRKITMTEPQKQREEYGLNVPVATVEVGLKNQQNHRLVLGKPDFNKSFLYAQVDPPVEASKALDVVLVPMDFENAVDRPVSEWKKEENQPKSEEKPKQNKPVEKQKESTTPAKDKPDDKQKTMAP